MLRGIDVSSNNGGIAWPAVAASGIAFAFLKATEGEGYADATYRTNRAQARAAGLVVGHYAYSRPDLVGNTPEGEAQWFLSQVQADLQPGDLLALDLEVGSGDLSPWALRWLQTVAVAVGFLPLVYSYPDFIRQHVQATALSAHPLWLASYLPAGSAPDGTSTAWVPCPLPWHTYALWQWTAESHVAGVTGPVDQSVIARDLAGLRALGKPSPVAPPASHAFTVAVSHFLRRLPAADAPHVEATIMQTGELVDANAAPPAGQVRETTHWLYVRRRSTRALGYALRSNLQALSS